MAFLEIPAPAWLKHPTVKLPELNANPYLVEARRRLERLAALDLSRPLSRPALLVSGLRAEAHHYRLAEAWKRAQAAIGEFERHLSARAVLAGKYGRSLPFAPETFKTILLTHYCANILRYQAALGKRTGVPSRPVPVEWMQMAAAAAIVSVIQTALMLWVMNRPAARPSAARRRAASPRPAPAPVRVFVAPRAIGLPLRL